MVMEDIQRYLDAEQDCVQLIAQVTIVTYDNVALVHLGVLYTVNFIHSLLYSIII